MAIKKKGNVDFLKDVAPANLSADNTENTVGTTEKEATAVEEKEEAQPKKKAVENWGRPRKSLIEGVKETSVTVQLPETLIKALRKEGKKQGKSMKEMIGEALLSTYTELL